MGIVVNGRTHTIERIASLLHGIEIVPPQEQSKMVQMACLEANKLVEEASRSAIQFAAQILREDVDTHCPSDSWYRTHFNEVADRISNTKPNHDEILYQTLKRLEWLYPSTSGGLCPLCRMSASKGHERGCLLACQIDSFEQAKIDPVRYCND